MRLWRRSNSILQLPVASRWLIINMIAGYWFSRLPWSWRRGIGIRQVKMPQISLFLLRLSHFSWINTPQIAASLEFIYRVWGKLTENFYSFYKEFLEFLSLPFSLTLLLCSLFKNGYIQMPYFCMTNSYTSLRLSSRVPSLSNGTLFPAN